jgi:hypothetical protein
MVPAAIHAANELGAALRAVCKALELSQADLLIGQRCALNLRRLTPG